MNNRISFIDNLKCFAIICVMLGHGLQYLTGDHPENVYSFNFIYTFHMPLFMMLSGYFFSSSLRLSLGKFFRKKAYQLLLPAISWSLIKVLLGGGKSLSGIIDYFWFLKSVFLCYMITYIAVRIIKKEDAAYIMLILISLFLDLNVSTYMLNYMLPCFVCGSILRKQIQFVMLHREKLLCVSSIVYLLMVPYWHFSEYHYVSVWQDEVFCFHEELVLLHRLIIGLSGSFALFILFSYVKKTNRFVQKIGSTTLGLYVMNGLFSDIHRHFFLATINSEIVCLLIASTLVSIQIPLFIFLMNTIKRNKYMGFILFGTKR